jgi:hypothetical protein
MAGLVVFRLLVFRLPWMQFHLLQAPFIRPCVTSLVPVHDSTLLPVIFSTSTICLHVMPEAHRISSAQSFQQPASSTANLAGFLRSTGPPDLPSFPSTANTISKSVRSKSVPRRWLRKVASKIGIRKEKASDRLFPESPHLSIKEFSDG